MSLAVLSPVAGTTLSMTEVPDAVFAEAMVGPGIAVRPDGERADAVSPIDGTVATLHPHAFVVAAEDGRAVLVHLGIDTVKQQGEGFTLHVTRGEEVRAGQPVISWNPEAVEAAGYSPVVPVVALDAASEALALATPGTPIDAASPLFTWRD